MKQTGPLTPAELFPSCFPRGTICSLWAQAHTPGCRVSNTVSSSEVLLPYSCKCKHKSLNTSQLRVGWAVPIPTGKECLLSQGWAPESKSDWRQRWAVYLEAALTSWWRMSKFNSPPKVIDRRMLSGNIRTHSFFKSSFPHCFKKGNDFKYKSSCSMWKLSWQEETNAFLWYNWHFFWEVFFLGDREGLVSFRFLDSRLWLPGICNKKIQCFHPLPSCSQWNCCPVNPQPPGLPILTGEEKQHPGKACSEVPSVLLCHSPKVPPCCS